MFTVRGQDSTVGTASGGRLTALGLITPQGEIRADLRLAMTAFAYAPVAVDLRFTAGRASVRAAAAVHDDTAYLAVVTGGHTRFSRFPAEAAIAALVGVLPTDRPAAGTAVTLPMADVDAALTRSMESTGLDVFTGTLMDRGVAPEDARLFAQLAGGRRIRLAEFGVTFLDRAGRRQRAAGTVQVVDTRRGRTVLCARDGYVLASPADEVTVARELTMLRDAEIERLRGHHLG
jgi:hypothetical protein